MKKYEWRYSLKAGFKSLGRHPILVLAAISTLAIMLFLMSAFVAVSLNARKLSKIAAQQPPIEISLRIGVSDEELQQIDAFMSSHDKIQEYIKMTPEQNFDQFVKNMGKEDLWTGFEYKNYIPYTYNVRLNDPTVAPDFRKEVEALSGVGEVLMETQLMSVLNRIERWTGRISVVSFVVLAVIVTLVMMNTVRVAVLSRSREINIMKYVGATNAYIRIPFIVEGAAIGFIGALVASLASALLYNYFVERFKFSATVAASAFSFIASSQMTAFVFVLNIITGMLLCVVICAFSVRRYVRV